MWTWGGRKAVFGGRTGDSTGVKGGKPSSAPSTTDKRGVKSRTRGDKYKPDVVVWVKKKSTRVKRTSKTTRLRFRTCWHKKSERFMFRESGTEPPTEGRDSVEWTRKSPSYKLRVRNFYRKDRTRIR